MPLPANTVKLGKRAPRHDPRTLQLANYLRTAALPPPPPTKSWYGAVTEAWGMMGNDTIGDCTCAAAGHMIECWTANVDEDATVVPTDQEIIAAYSAVTGYDPNTGVNDNGAVEMDVLNYWRKTGIGGHQIKAYAALEPGNFQHIQNSIALFGGAYLGLNLPISAQTQTVWSIPPGGPTGQGAPGSWGGHAVPVFAYDGGGLTVVTWGALQRMTWGFWSTYCDEAYAVLSQDFVDWDDLSPDGVDINDLLDDLHAVTNS